MLSLANKVKVTEDQDVAGVLGTPHNHFRSDTVLYERTAVCGTFVNLNEITTLEMLT